MGLGPQQRQHACSPMRLFCLKLHGSCYLWQGTELYLLYLLF